MNKTLPKWADVLLIPLLNLFLALFIVLSSGAKPNRHSACNPFSLLDRRRHHPLWLQKYWCSLHPALGRNHLPD